MSWNGAIEKWCCWCYKQCSTQKDRSWSHCDCDFFATVGYLISATPSIVNIENNESPIFVHWMPLSWNRTWERQIKRKKRRTWNFVGTNSVLDNLVFEICISQKLDSLEVSMALPKIQVLAIVQHGETICDISRYVRPSEIYIFRDFSSHGKVFNLWNSIGKNILHRLLVVETVIFSVDNSNQYFSRMKIILSLMEMILCIIIIRLATSQ